MVKQWDDEWSVGSGYSLTTTHKAHDGEPYLTGEVATQHGWVMVYSQHYLTRLDFIYKGRCFCRYFDKRYTKRGLVTKAKRFAKEIAEDKD